MLHARDFPQHSWGGGVAAPVLQQDDDYAAADMEPPAGTAGEQTELAPPDLSELARREPGLETRGTYTFKNHVPPAPGPAVKERPRNYVMHQQSWKQLVSKAKTLVASEFWTVFETVRGQSQGLQCEVLRATKAVLLKKKCLVGSFPTSKRQLRKMLAPHVRAFWQGLLLQCSVDVSGANLPARCKRLYTFQFVDPIWIWVFKAGRCGELHFESWHHANAQHERLYGAGVQYGDAMIAALRQCTAAQLPAFIGLAFDKAKQG